MSFYHTVDLELRLRLCYAVFVVSEHASLATKKDLANLEFKLLGEILSNRSEIVKTEERFTRKLENLVFEIKSDLGQRLNSILSEIVASRDERVVHSAQISRNTDRIERLEQEVGIEVQR